MRTTLYMRFWFVVFAAVAALSSSPVSALTVSGLYDAAVRTTDRSEQARDAAFVEALRIVAVRVSGTRTAAAKLGAISNPRQYVRRFGYNAEGMFEVGFDSAAVDRLLAQAGLPLWGRERPATVIALVDESPAPAAVAGAASPASDREIIERAAQLRGVPLRWAETGAANSRDLAALAASFQADAVLVGRELSDTTTEWTFRFGDEQTSVRGTLEDGIHLAADRFAAVFAAAPGAASSVALEVGGIENLEAYAGTLGYLEGLTLVKAVEVQQVARDLVRFKIAIRGDAETFKRAVALDHKLTPDAARTSPAGDAQILAFRYQP